MLAPFNLTPRRTNPFPSTLILARTITLSFTLKSLQAISPNNFLSLTLIWVWLRALLITESTVAFTQLGLSDAHCLAVFIFPSSGTENVALIIPFFIAAVYVNRYSLSPLFIHHVLTPDTKSDQII